jgi:hypothetical protein
MLALQHGIVIKSLSPYIIAANVAPDLYYWKDKDPAPIIRGQVLSNVTQ